MIVIVRIKQIRYQREAWWHANVPVIDVIGSDLKGFEILPDLCAPGSAWQLGEGVVFGMDHNYFQSGRNAHQYERFTFYLKGDVELWIIRTAGKTSDVEVQSVTGAEGVQFRIFRRLNANAFAAKWNILAGEMPDDVAGEAAIRHRTIIAYDRRVGAGGSFGSAMPGVEPHM